MKKWLLFAILFIAAASVPAEAQSRYEWRQATTEQQLRSLNNPRNTDGIELYSSQGKLVIKTPVKTTVRVLTILGQTISQAVVEPGTFELNLNTHGIFIVKVGDYTLRVAL